MGSRTSPPDGANVQAGTGRSMTAALGGEGARVAGGAGGEPLRLALVRDAPPDEQVVAGPGQLHRVPLRLLADGVDRRLLVEGHPVDDPRPGVARLPHRALLFSLSDRKS